jgi:hypothetical protein
MEEVGRFGEWVSDLQRRMVVLGGAVMLGVTAKASGARVGMAQVWTVGFDDGYPVRVGCDFLDGDIRKTEYVDTSVEIKTVGGHFDVGAKRLGRALKPINIPTKFRWGGAAERMPDIMLTHSVMLVSDKVKDIVESLEPKVHQFFPLETWAKGNKPAQRMYLMNICNRLDTVDREKTTKPFVSSRYWDTPKPGELFFSLAQIGHHKFWHDKHIFDAMFFTDDVKDQFVSAGVTGVNYYGTPAI